MTTPTSRPPSETGAKPPYFLVFDVESIGLHGEGFAVGWVVVAPNGAEYEKGYLACPPENAHGTPVSRKWCAENLPSLVPNKETPRGVRDGFWQVWQTWKANGAVLAADCQWPVEARFLAQCVDENVADREWSGPYPLHDIASVLLALGLDPLATRERLDGEKPRHHPEKDAKQSARLMVEAFRSHTALLADRERLEGDVARLTIGYDAALKVVGKACAHLRVGKYKDFDEAYTELVEPHRAIMDAGYPPSCVIRSDQAPARALLKEPTP